ncbi:hypothetical protein [Pseudoduganella armeniaca]|uniref:Uncharacterized protein n=1 Tax=Pseudoduganella armeniaca TaxID=2072590 RepID=A0A2R4CBZ4_9BURK|nr:hypothetical protein [Pseudoduganella armeniaca]AVR97136.1 hypothetical protein C9I28_16920 [Pseudoduganella armeniaca]
MQELIAQLTRLYLPSSQVGAPELSAQLEGQATHAFALGQDGAVRAIVLGFDAQPDADGAAQWERLCEAANQLQAGLGLPAPAVSIDGATGYRLWLSFAEPVPAALAQQLHDLLRAAYCPAMPRADVLAPVALPPCLNRASGRWAAFIHPGMGASFADEPGLEMRPPLAAQAAFLQGVERASMAQVRQAVDSLRRAPEEPIAAPDAAATPEGLLLKDATLEDIVRHLHAMNIEPTFRHVLPVRNA